MITISAKVLSAIAKWASTDETLPHLCTILFQDNLAIATDGHRMVLLPCPTNGEPMLIYAEHAQAAVAAHRSIASGQSGINITRSDDKKNAVLAIAPRVNLIVPLRDPTKYPPYEQAIPKQTSSNSPNGYVLNPQFLADVAEVNAAVSGIHRGVKVVAWSDDRLGAMLFEGHEGVRYAIMPMRCI